MRAELEALATEVATPRMTAADLDALDAAEQRFSELTLELREQARRGLASESPLFVEWMQANYAFHDVIYAVAAMPLVERLAKGARRTFIGDRVWSARVELDELYAKNDLQHRAIREAIAAGSAAGARLLAREHVLSSGRLTRDRDRVARTAAAATPAGAASRGSRDRDAASVRMSGTVRSGVADAGGVAPKPARSWRRSTHAVVRPSCLARDVVVEEALGGVEDAVARHVDRRERELERRGARLVGARLLGGDDPVERDAEAAVREREEVAVAVRDHAEPEPLLEAAQRRRRVVKGGPVSERVRKRCRPRRRWGRSRARRRACRSDAASTRGRAGRRRPRASASCLA